MCPASGEPVGCVHWSSSDIVVSCALLYILILGACYCDPFKVLLL